jgi:hypothetical protein
MRARHKETSMDGEITFRGELSAIPADADLVLKIDRNIDAYTQERIKRHCEVMFGKTRQILIIGPEIELQAVKRPVA